MNKTCFLLPFVLFQCTQNTVQPSPSSVTSAVPLPPKPIPALEPEHQLEPEYRSNTRIVIKNLDENAKYNIALAAKAINGMSLKPGQSFSFNEVVGERTTERGFKKATSLYGGLPIKTPGGGVCAAATAVYQAAMSTGLLVTSRVPHTRPRSYAEYGMDAAVNWPNKDLVFQNNSDQDIFLDFKTSNDKENFTMNVSLVTKKELPTYESEWFTISKVPFEKIEKASVKINQPVIKRKGEKGLLGYRVWKTPKPTKVKSFYHPIDQIKIVPYIQ